MRIILKYRCRPFHGLGIQCAFRILGFRFAPSQALCCQPLCGLKTDYAWMDLRGTKGKTDQ
jgi:hypothetical protein